MTKTINRLLKLLENNNPDEHRNIVDTLTDEEKVKIVDDVINGIKIDDDSRRAWLDTNQEAMRIIKHCEDDTDKDKNESEIYKSAKVIYPLLSPAIIQLASRMIQNITRNNRVLECAVLGKDKLIPNPDDVLEMQQQMEQIQQLQQTQQNPQPQQPQQGQQPQQPRLVGAKAFKAKNTSDYMNYQLLVESKTWLKDQHKSCTITAAWGTSFKRVYYDPIEDKNVCDLISPEDVIINHGNTSLEKAKRISIRHFMTVNDIISQIRSGYFVDVDFEKLKNQRDESEKGTNSETDPAGEVFCQYTYLDLDDDGYKEPYKVWIHKDLNILLGIFPAFSFDEKENDIKLNSKGEVIRIVRRLDLVDDHLIDDPEGGYYSIGLNYLLLHQNKSITAVLRMLLDSGALANAASCTGFITNAFQTRERDIEFELGSYKQVDVNMNVNPQQHIIPLPAKEPSQILLGLLQLLIQGGEKSGGITDILTGDIAGQNVPATTMLAIVEQATRAFKPVLMKFYIARKTEFQFLFRLNAKHIQGERYALFNNSDISITGKDFDIEMMDVAPVGDPTQSSEANKYAKVQFHMQMLQQKPNLPELNTREIILEIYDLMGDEKPERFVMKPSPPPPDPKMEQVKVNAQKVQQDGQLEQSKLALSTQKQQTEHMKGVLKMYEAQIAASESADKKKKLEADTLNEVNQTHIQAKMALIAQQQANTDAKRVEVMKIQAQKKG